MKTLGLKLTKEEIMDLENPRARITKTDAIRLLPALVEIQKLRGCFDGQNPESQHETAERLTRKLLHFLDAMPLAPRKDHVFGEGEKL